MGGPVEGTEKGAGRDRRVRRLQFAVAHTGGDQCTDAALVAIALGDDRFAQRRRQGVDLEVRRGSLEVVDEAAHVGEGEGAEARPERTAACRASASAASRRSSDRSWQK